MCNFSVSTITLIFVNIFTGFVYEIYNKNPPEKTGGKINFIKLYLNTIEYNEK